jgi:site-specific recombinase
MALLPKVRRLLHDASGKVLFTPGETILRRRTESFCAATTYAVQSRLLVELFASIWMQPSDRIFQIGLARWVHMLEEDPDLCGRFQQAWRSVLGTLDSVSFFAETGIPAQHALLPETTRRVFQRLLPSAREDTDTARLFAAVFASSRAAQRFVELESTLFTRLTTILWDPQGLAAFSQLRDCLHQALCLLAARVAGRGTTAAVRQRSTTQQVEESPFYRLVFATEKFVRPGDSEPPSRRHESWMNAIYACRGELALVRIHMEDAGVSTALVFDLSTMDAALDRMEMLAATLVEHTSKPSLAARQLLNTLVCGLLEDTRISALIRQNLNLLARKTVERTGESGEHYIAHSRKEYWLMWRAALGGGILTVFTAAIKLHIIATKWPPFIEGTLVGTNYAISFLLLQIFGLALATKQPSMTAATLADIIRHNRGASRRDKIADFASSISRTQLAAALGNIIAVSAGAVVFNFIWHSVFGAQYVQADQAEKVYRSLRPIASGTIIFAALTGILLWLAALIGGWCENFAVFNRIPEAIAQHPLGHRIGAHRMQSIADWYEHNVAAWSTSIALGYLMGFTPEIAKFFGLPLDVRHVTLNTGMFAFAAASFGFSAFRQFWLYSAVGGIAIMFVLNLGVSFAIASYVALRAYDVGREERISLLKYVLRQIAQSPSRFLYPVEPRPAAALPVPETPASAEIPVPAETPASAVELAAVEHIRIHPLPETPPLENSDQAQL